MIFRFFYALFLDVPMKNIYEVLSLEELFCFYGYPSPNNEQFLNILYKLAFHGLDIYGEIQDMQTYKFIFHDQELKEDLIKKHITKKYEKYRKKGF